VNIGSGFAFLFNAENHGSVWSNVSNYPHNSIRCIALRDDGVGLVGGDSGKIARTTDSGVTWTDISSAYPHARTIFGIVLRDDGVGLAAGALGTIARTTDSGVTWTKIFESYEFTNLSFESLVLRDDGVGLAVGLSGEIARTTDSGVTWTDISSAYPHSGSILSVALRDDGVGLAVGVLGQIARTTDSGVTWTDISSAYPHSSNVRSVALRDDGVGLAVGDSGDIARTTDSGVTWTDISSAYPHHWIILSVTLCDDGVGLAVGQSGEIARTTDSGVTWTDISSAYPHSNASLQSVVLRENGMGLCGDNVAQIARTVGTSDTFTPPPANAWHHYHLKRNGSTVSLTVDGTVAASIDTTGLDMSAAPLQITLSGTSKIDDLLLLEGDNVVESEITAYRQSGQPWTDDADTRDMRIQARDGRDINYVTTGGGVHRFEGGVSFPVGIDTLEIAGELRFTSGYVLNRDVPEADANGTSCLWLLGEWGSSSLNVQGQLLGQRSSGHDDIHKIDFGVSSQAHGMNARYIAYMNAVSYHSGGTDGSSYWYLSRVTYGGQDYAALRYDGKPYWRSTLRFTGYLWDTPGIPQNEVFSNPLTMADVTLVGNLTLQAG
jgi:photosystem II stability/assembly factor-like uncharacterized protein